jgi:hypothetical protein
MLNKLKTTTALVGALSIAATASYAETKITGDIEQTYISHSQDLAANKVDGSGGFGHETNLTLTSSKTLANGIKADFGYTLEQNGRVASSDTKYLTLSSGNFFVAVGEDFGDNLQSSVIPFVSDNFETIGGSSGAGLSFDSHGSGITTVAGTATSTNLNVHEYAHIAAGFKFDGGQATFRYAPNTSAGADDSTINSATSNVTNSSSQSAIEYLVSGKVQGVGYRLGKMQAEKDHSGSSGGKPDYTVYGLSYSMNGFTVAAERRNTDDGSTAATAETKATQYGVAYATKDFSAGIYMLKNDRDATALEEEAKMIQVGYNFGGLGFDVSYMQIENASFTSGRDADVWQIRTVQKF